MEEAKDEISIKLEKQNLIKDEIINNGLDSIQFIEYLIQCKGPGGENINDWSITDLKHAINDFIYLNKNMNKNKNNSQAENKEQNKKENQIENEKEEGKEKEKNELSNNNKPLNSNINDKDVKENKVDMPAPVAPKEENLSKSVLKNILDISNNLFIDSSKKNEKINYGLETPDSLDCRPVDKTDLGVHEEIYVKIGFPEKIDGGFFGRDSVSFTIAAIPLGFVVKRNYLDFEWLRDILIKLYGSNFIPSLPQLFSYQRSNEDMFFKECIRNLERFVNYLISDPIIRCSQIIYDFLCEENDDEFKKKKIEYENTTPSNDIQNFQSITGKIDINITEKVEKDFEKIKNDCYDNQKLFKQLSYNLVSIEEDFCSIIRKLAESSKIWEKLYKLNENNDEKILQKNIYSQMKNMFLSLDKTVKKERDLLKINLKENFSFFSNNISNFSQMINKVDEYKKIFKKEEKDLVSLKNDLYSKKLGGSEIDKNVDLSNLLPRNTEATLEMKKNYGYFLNRTIIEYERMKNLDNSIYNTDIKKSFQTQLSIAKSFEGEMQKIISALDELEKQKKNEIKKDEEKKENKSINKNEIIIEEDKKEKNVINQNEIKNNEEEKKEKNNNDV